MKVCGFSVWNDEEPQSSRTTLRYLLRTRRYVSTYSLAAIHAGLGEKDQAWVWLEKAYQGRASWLSSQPKVDPRFDSLYSEPRYQDLLRRVGLSP